MGILGIFRFPADAYFSPIAWMDLRRGDASAATPDGGTARGRLSLRQASLVQALAQAFYEVVPGELRTYCSLTARIAQAALEKLDVPAHLTPCQVWLTAPGNNYVVGFLGNAPREGKWDGHVVCSAGDWFLDTALSHFKLEFGKDTPAVIAGRTFQVRTSMIARVDLNPSERLAWITPPEGAESTPPDEPPELVARYAQALAERVKASQHG